MMDFKLQNIKVQMKTIENNLDNISMMINMPNANIKSQFENLGIQMLNLGIEIFTNSLTYIGIGNTFDSAKQLTNISLQIQNLINQLNIYNMPMPFIPMNNNLNISPMPMMPININNNNNKELGITFKSVNGKTKTLFLDSKITVSEMLQKYLLSIGKPELFNLKNKIVFIYNASMLRYDDQTKIENLFGNYGSHSIMVSDVDNMIGG